MYVPASGMIPLEDFFDRLVAEKSNFKTVKNSKREVYYNIPAAFDIEVSSFYQNGIVAPDTKRGIMYIWQFGIGNIVTYGRTWEEFKLLTKVLSTELDLCGKTLVVYVHNLAYEFQFMRKHFNWDKVFQLDERKPVYAMTDGIEFRCSMKLAGGKSLAMVGKDLIKYPVEKKVGDLDYELIRTADTPLSKKELGYCENDIRVLLHYIQEKIESDGNITRIPLTNTGYVRKFCRKKCRDRGDKYRRIMESLTLDQDEFGQLTRGFQGGYTHANAHFVQKRVLNVASYDFTSSYPAVMLLEQFPMSRAKKIDKKVTKEEFVDLLKTKCCLFDLELFDVTPRRHNAHPLSFSKCVITKEDKKETLLDNGRIVMCPHLRTTCTEQDFFVLREFYNWDLDRGGVSKLRVYDKGYLPKQFSDAIIELYAKKTTLKDVEGEEINYMISKNMLNAAYGMCVTNPVRDEYLYENDKFDTKKLNEVEVADALKKYNESMKRFLFYPWGVWVTSLARANLFSGILACGEDFVYSDTDSVKLINHDMHKSYFDAYNKGVMRKIEKSASIYKRSPEDYIPRTKEGKEKPIGVWDFEGVFDEFKTLGAKRYLVRVGDKYILTLAGANKWKARDFLVSTRSPFDTFDNGLCIPPDASGRLLLTYIDEPTSGTVIDYMGKEFSYTELSSIHMEKSEYNLTMGKDFIDYLRGAMPLE